MVMTLTCTIILLVAQNFLRLPPLQRSFKVQSKEVAETRRQEHLATNLLRFNCMISICHTTTVAVVANGRNDRRTHPLTNMQEDI